MSFSGGGGGFAGAEETLAYMIKAFDLATPVFRSFGAAVSETTKQVQASLAEMNRALGLEDKAMTDSLAHQEAALKRLQTAYATTGVKSAELAKMQADLAKRSVVASDEQGAAAKRAAVAQETAAAKSVTSHDASSAALSRYGKNILLFASGGAAASLDFATKFQANTLRMQTQAGATAKGLDQIRQGLLKMAGQVGATPDQLANGMYHVVSSMNAVLPPATRVSQELQIMKIAAEGAKIGHANLEDTTYALSAAMNALHQNASMAKNTMGDLNAIVGSGDMNMQDLIDAMKSGLIPAANSFGISLQSVGAALSVMGDMGMRGALAGTRLRMAISLLGAPTAQAAKILETLGLSAKQSISTSYAMADALKKAGVSATQVSYDLKQPDGLQVALKDLDNHLQAAGLSATGAGAVISRAFGGGRMGSAIMLMAENTDRLKLKFDQIGQTAGNFDQGWALTSKTFKVELDKALASVEALGIGFGEKLIPPATTALHDLEAMANWLVKNKVALDLLAGAVISFSTVAVGSFLIKKLGDAATMMTHFGGGAARLGGWVMGGTWGGPGTSGPMPSSPTEPRVGGGGGLIEVPRPGGIAGAVSAATGGLYGVNSTQIRVGSLMNPMAVYLASARLSGGAHTAAEAAAREAAGVPPVAATASDKAAQDEVDAAIAKMDKTMQAAITAGLVTQNAAGRYVDPKTKAFMSEGTAYALGTAAQSEDPMAIQRLQTAMAGAAATGKALTDAEKLTLAAISETTPGLVSLNETIAAEEEAIRAASMPGGRTMWHATASENVPSILREGMIPDAGPWGPHGGGIFDIPPATYLSSTPEGAQHFAEGITGQRGFQGGAVLRTQVPPTYGLNPDPEHRYVEQGFEEEAAMEGFYDHPLYNKAFYTTENIPPSRIQPIKALWTPQELAAMSNEEALAAQKQMLSREQMAARQSMLDAQMARPPISQETNLFQHGLGADAAAAGQLSLFGTVPAERAMAETRYTPYGVGSPFAGMGGAFAREHLGGKLPSLAGVKGFMSEAGGNLMRGGMVAGMGVMGAQMVGQMVPGKTGSAISSVGSMAALGAGIGSAIEPGIGTAIGGALGGVAGAIEHFLGHSASFGQNAANRLTPGFGGDHRPGLQADLAKSIDAMASIVHPGTRTAGTAQDEGRFGPTTSRHPISQEITLDIKQLNPDQLARYMAAAKRAGQDLAGTLEKGWNQYKFQSEPIMFKQLKSEASGMPPALQAYAVQSAVSFTQGLEKQGRVVKGSAAAMLRQAEIAFPEFKKFLGLEGAAGMQEFTKALDLSHTQDRLKTQLDSMRGDFPELTKAMDTTSGDIVTKSEAVIQALTGISEHGSKPARERASADIKALRNTVVSDISAAAAMVDSQSKAMAASVAKGSGAAADVAHQNWTKYVQIIQNAESAGVITVQEGNKLIAKEFDAAMLSLGLTSHQASNLAHAGYTVQGVQNIVGGHGMGGATAAFGKAAGHATGGRVHTPMYMVGEEAPAHPEYVISTNPRDRHRMLPLVAEAAQKLGIPGYRFGGQVSSFGALTGGGTTNAGLDQGWDFTGRGPVFSLGPGVVTRDESSGSGWPGQGALLVYQLTGGPATGRYIYTAEDFQPNPALHVGSRFPRGFQIGMATGAGLAPGIETGFAQNAMGQAYGNIHEGKGGAAPDPQAVAFQAFVEHGKAVPGGAIGGVSVPILRAPHVRGGGSIGQVAQAILNSVTKAANAKLAAAAAAAGGASGGIGSLTAGPVAAQVAQFMGAAGFNKIAIAGMLGNAMQESSMDPNAPGGGLFQQISNFGGGTGGSLLHQLQRMLPQIMGLRGAMNAAGSPGAAATIFEQQFERAGIPALANRIAYANQAFAAGYARGGKVNWAGAFGDGGAFTAHRPTLAMFGDKGSETVVAMPHFAGGGVYSSPTIGLPDSSMPPARNTPTTGGTQTTSSSTTTSAPVVHGDTTSTTSTTVSTNAQGVTTVHTHTTTHPTHTHAKTTHYTVGFNPISDQIESHTSTEWQKIHAAYSKQRHDAAEAKKKYDAWLAQTVNDMLTVGGVTAGAIDLTRKQAIAEHLPTGGRSVSLTSARGLDHMTDAGFAKVLAGLKHYLSIDDLSSTMKLLTREMRSLHRGVSQTSRPGQIASALIGATLGGVANQFSNQQKQFQHTDTVLGLIEKAPAGTTAKSLGFTGAQLKALGITRGEIKGLAGADSGPAAFKQQVDELSNQVIPAYQKDAKQLTVAYHAALKTHNKKLQHALLTQLDAVSQAEAQAITDKQTAQVSLVEATYQKGQTNMSQTQSGVDIVKAIQGMAPGTDLNAIGLGRYSWISSLEGGNNAMGAAQLMNSALGNERGQAADTMNQLISQLPSLKGSALDAANQHILDLSKSIAGLTQEINANLMDAIKAVAQGFQDQADLAAGGGSVLSAIGDIAPGTNLSALGLGPGALSALGLDPNTAASIEGGGSSYLSTLMGLQNNTLTSDQVGAAQRFTTAINNNIKTQLGDANSGLIGELDYDISQLPGLTGTDRTGMLGSIDQLAGKILSLIKSMDDNTKATDKLTGATNASTTATGQMTGTVGYSYRNQDFSASLGSETPVNLGVGS